MTASLQAYSTGVLFRATAVGFMANNIFPLRSGRSLLLVAGYTVLACKVALERFGIAPETAVAPGTLIHAVFWLSLTSLGLLVLRSRRTSFGEIEEVALPSDDAAER